MADYFFGTVEIKHTCDRTCAHTIALDPGQPCGKGVYTGQDIMVFSNDAWQGPRKQIGFCEKPNFHFGACTHLLSSYHRRPSDQYRP